MIYNCFWSLFFFAAISGRQKMLPTVAGVFVSWSAIGCQRARNAKFAVALHSSPPLCLNSCLSVHPLVKAENAHLPFGVGSTAYDPLTGALVFSGVGQVLRLQLIVTAADERVSGGVAVSHAQCRTCSFAQRCGCSLSVQTDWHS